MHIPSLLDSHVKSFCREILPHSKPLYVPVEPLPDKPINECFSIVPEHVASYGGKQCIGWAIWEWKKVLIEAEFHSVWQTPNNTLIDITPKIAIINRIVFLPDPSRQYTGIAIDNIRKPIRNDKRIRRFCDLFHERFLELNKGDLAHQYGEVNLSPEAASRIWNILQDMAKLEHELIAHYGER